MAVVHFRSRRLSTTLLILVLSSLVLIILGGCGKKMVCSTVPTFFPQPPDEPRIQYLTGITSELDIGATDAPDRKQGAFSMVVTGQQDVDIIRKIGKSFGITAYNGKLYVAESGFSRVVIVDPVKGTFEYPKGMSASKGALKTPTSIALDEEGLMYVADAERNEVVVFAPDGSYVNSFGKEFQPIFSAKPKVSAVNIFDGKLYVLDMGANRIRVLNRKTGEEIEEPFGYVKKPNQSLRKPGNFAMDATGNSYVTNIGNNMMMKYDLDGNFIGSLGGMGDTFGKFVKPKGIALDAEGRIYVVDAGTNLVQLFDDQFRLLTYFGWPGLETGSLNMPAGIAVTSDEALLRYFRKYAVKGFEVDKLIFVINQFGQEFCIPRITVYGLGQMAGKKPATVDAPEKNTGE